MELSSFEDLKILFQSVLKRLSSVSPSPSSQVAKNQRAMGQALGPHFSKKRRLRTSRESRGPGRVCETEILLQGCTEMVPCGPGNLDAFEQRSWVGEG